MTTKININDHDALDAAFACAVAGMSNVHWHVYQRGGLIRRTLAGTPKGGHKQSVPTFTRSMDAVLPWLEKEVFWSNTFNSGHHIAPSERNWVTVGIGGGREFEGYAPTLPHAAVVALLRAKGVTVEEHAEPDKP